MARFSVDRQPPAVAGEAAVAADHAMAGDQDGERGLAIGRAPRADRVHPAYLASNVAVRACLAVGDRRHRAPHLLLELRPLGREREVELVALPREVLAELPDRPGEGLE